MACPETTPPDAYDDAILGESFPRELRVRRQRDFDRVYQSNTYAADEVLVINLCQNGQPQSRLGLSVSRKVGPAVTRNHWKRLIREVFRRRRNELPQGLDIVARPRRGAQPDFTAIDQSLPRLVSRAARKHRGDKRSSRAAPEKPKSRGT